MSTVIICYDHDYRKHPEFYWNLECNVPCNDVVFLTDGPIPKFLSESPAPNSGFQFIPMKRCQVPYTTSHRGIGKNRRPADHFALWAFVRAIEYCKFKGHSHFIWIEPDCRFTKPQWDLQMLAEFHKDSVIGGTPVIWHPWSEGAGMSMSVVQFAFEYQEKSGVPMAMHGNDDGPIGFAMYPNGALGIYKVSEMELYFKTALSGQMSPREAAEFSEDVIAFDTLVGRCFTKTHGINIFSKFSAITCVYSGCGNQYVTQKERLAMIEHKTKVAVHQVKE